MIRINFVCFGNHSGYSQASQDMMLALHQSGKYDIRLQYLMARVVPRSGLTDKRKELFDTFMDKERTDDHIQVYHCIPTVQYHVPPTRRNIGYGMFETFQPPNEGPLSWISALNKNDAIIAPSNFNYRIFAHEKITKPLFYIPCCYDTTVFHDKVEPLEHYDKFTFLFFGSWRQRKGYLQLIEAFCREFNKKDNVQLVIKTDKVATAEASVKTIKKNLGLDKKECAPILFESRVFDNDMLPRFIKSAHCLVSPTLGEGFGLPGLQSMALGVPVTITDFSGCKDYANNETCTLIEPAGYVLHNCLDGLPQNSGKKWAYVTAAEVQRVMRHVYHKQVEIKHKAEYAKAYVKERFSYEKVESLFSEMLRTVFNV